MIRTIALRLTGTEQAKEQLKALGEDVDDFTVTTVSKLDQKIKDLTKTQGKAGVSLLDMNGNYRSTYEILQDIADIWGKIAEEDKKTGQNRQNALLEMMAGKNRANILGSILESPEILRDAFESSQNSEGSAQEELNKHLDSINGKIELLTNATQEFWATLINSESIKTIIDFLTNVVKFGTQIIDIFGTIPTLLATIGAGITLHDRGGRVKMLTLNKVMCHRVV